MHETLYLQVSDRCTPIPSIMAFRFAVSNKQTQLGPPILQSLMHRRSIPDVENGLAISCNRTGLQDKVREHAH